ncbi:hypothetical protein [Cesiribacter sp. SM1]|uniref:hypothetical protein n=1 Tax=Cesiribacter sp. SM1 TaxID=2861196 RepID=UPI001CD64281|nr:hypothetical protein [Cesiribacter sp. SM1]
MEEAHQTRDKDALLHLYNKTLPALAARIHQNLQEITPLFHNFLLEKAVDTWTKDPDANTDSAISIENGNVQQMALRLRLEGFQRAGVPAFDISKNLVFELGRAMYTVSPDKDGDEIEKQYYQPWTESEIREVAQRWCDDLIDEITQRLESIT